MADPAIVHTPRLFKRKYPMRAFGALLLGIAGVSASRWEGNAVLPALLFAAGVLLVGAALAGRLWTSAYHAGHKNRLLLTTGPYSVCRNPMYFCNFVGGIGALLATGTFTLPLSFAVVFACFEPAVIRHEEENLLRRHGAAFDAYRERTPAFLPRWSQLEECESVTLNARLFRSKMLDSFAPTVLLAAIGALHILHAHDALPVLFHCY